MEVSICITVYNTLPVLRQCLAAAIETSGNDTEILLVNNHPPYQDVQEFFSRPVHERVRVLDPGINLGCHLGVHYAFARSRGKYVVKLDDDIIVPRNDWLAAMQRALRDFPDLAYVSLPWPPIKTGLYRSVALHGYRLEFFPTRIYSSCQMMRRELWASRFSREGRRALYATFEGEYFEISSRLGMKRGYLISHPVRHLGRSNQTDLLYGVWKIFYARGKTRRDFVGWRKDFKLTPQEYSYLKQWGYPESQLALVRAEIDRLSRPARGQR